MSLTVAPTPLGTGHVLPFSQIAGNEGVHQTPYQGFLCLWTKLSDFRLSDNLTPHHHRGAVTQTVGPEPQGTGACSHFYK